MLDQNFPIQTTGIGWPPGLQVVRLDSVDRALTEGAEDWEVILELQHRRLFDGFITNDRRILSSPREMIAHERTELALIATDGVGHDPLIATGLVMVHLSAISLERSKHGGAMTYLLRPSGKRSLTPGRRLNEIAEHGNRSSREIRASEEQAIRAQVNERRPHLAYLFR